MAFGFSPPDFTSVAQTMQRTRETDRQALAGLGGSLFDLAKLQQGKQQNQALLGLQQQKIDMEQKRLKQQEADRKFNQKIEKYKFLANVDPDLAVDYFTKNIAPLKGIDLTGKSKEFTKLSLKAWDEYKKTGNKKNLMFTMQQIATQFPKKAGFISKRLVDLKTVSGLLDVERKTEQRQQLSEAGRGLAGLYSGEDLPRGPLPSKTGLAGEYLRAGGTPSGLKTLKETFTPVESKDSLKQERLAFERKRLSSAERRAEATAKIQRRQIEIAEKKLNLEYEKLTKQKPKGKKLSFSDIAKIIDSVERLALNKEGNISTSKAWSKFPSAREFAISKEDKNRLLRAFQINFGDPPIGFGLPITSGPTIPPGVNETDIEYTAKKHGISKEEVMKRLSNAP